MITFRRGQEAPGRDPWRAGFVLGVTLGWLLRAVAPPASASTLAKPFSATRTRGTGAEPGAPNGQPQVGEAPLLVGGRRAKRTVHVVVLTDWSEPRPHRCSCWHDLLGSSSSVAADVEGWPLADRSASADLDPGSRLGDDVDVLVVNWDAVNGDPEFGAHYARAWFEHRRPEIMEWVRGGKKLVIEGQATAHAPEQRAYDAILGPGELRVCGLEDKRDPLAQGRRVGEHGALAREFRDVTAFARLRAFRARNGRSYGELFGAVGTTVLNPALEGVDWEQVLYRGWFARRPFGKRRLAWVPAIETADRKRNHPTMMVARVGDGAVFATTMLIACSGQRHLAEAILTTSPSALPAPPRRFAQLRPHVERALTILAVVGGASVAGVAGGSRWSDNALANAFIGFGIGLAVLVVSAAAVWLARRLPGFVRDSFGL